MGDPPPMDNLYAAIGVHHCARRRLLTAICRKSRLVQAPKKAHSALSESKKIHDSILNLRHEVYAHSDIESRRIRPLKINGHSSAIELLPAMRLTKEQIEGLLNKISMANAAIDNRVGQLIDTAANET